MTCLHLDISTITSSTSMAYQTSRFGCLWFSSQKMENFLEILLDDFLSGAESFEYLLETSKIVQEIFLPKLLVEPATGSLFVQSLENKIIHRDIKASKILLDNRYGTKKDVVNKLWDYKMISPWLDLSIGWDLRKYEESFRQEKRKEAVERVSFFLFHRFMRKGGFYGKDTNYEHSDEAESKQMSCVRKNMTKGFLVSEDGMWHEIGFVYPQKGEAHDDWDGKISSQLQDKSTGCNLNKYGLPFSPDKRKKTVQRLLSCLITTIVFLWIIFDICTHSSIIQLQPLHKQHGLVFIWSSLLEPFSFMVFVWAIAATIVVGAPFSRIQSAMLMIWAILMLLRSAKSITEVYVPILGILFTGCYVLVEKQPELPN